MYCRVLCCIVLTCNVLYCTVLYCTVLSGPGRAGPGQPSDVRGPEPGQTPPTTPVSEPGSVLIMSVRAESGPESVGDCEGDNIQSDSE